MEDNRKDFRGLGGGVSRETLAVCDMLGNLLGYTSWSYVSDTMDPYIYKKREDIHKVWPDVEPGERSPSDFLVQVCLIENGMPKLPGRRCWANCELTGFTDSGWWEEPVDWGMGDYGYCDVIEPDEVAKKWRGK